MLKEDFNSTMVGKLLFNLVWQTVSLSLLQILQAMIGQIFIQAEVLRSSSENLLNNLDEGIYIMKEPSGVVLF